MGAKKKLRKRLRNLEHAYDQLARYAEGLDERLTKHELGHTAEDIARGTSVTQ